MPRSSLRALLVPTVLAMVFGSGWHLGQGGGNPPMKIGVLDINKAINAHASSNQLKEQLRKRRDDFQRRMSDLKTAIRKQAAALEELGRGTAAWSEANMKLSQQQSSAEIERKARLQQLSRWRTKQAMKLQRAVEAAASAYAKKRGLSLVLRSDPEDAKAPLGAQQEAILRRVVLFHADSVDITADVIQFAKTLGPKAADANGNK